MFLSKPEIIEMIKNESGNHSFDTVECRIKPEKNYNVYIFTAVLRDQKELTETWEEISSEVALYFQSTLDNEIEIWNIYILFLVQGMVDSEARYLVEQNKYSSRKLVIEDIKIPLAGKDIEEIIKEKLFHVKVESVSSKSNPKTTISNTLESNYKNLYSVIKNSHEKPSVLFENYLELLKNEL
jgi:hypothetical protein